MSAPAAEPKPKRKRAPGAGRPKGSGAYQPTPEQRQLVEAMAGYGIPEEEMVKLIVNPKTKQAIAEKTLRKHFRVELDRGMTNANVRVMNGMFKNATTATPQNPGGNPILQIFWSKVRLRWRQDDPGRTRPGDEEPPNVLTEEVNLHEAARRLAFTIMMGAREAAKQGAAPAKAAATPKKTVRA